VVRPYFLNLKELEKGIIIREPINDPSRFNSAVVCAPKISSKEQFRFAINYAPINAHINPPKHQDGYYNIKLTEDSYKYTAFQTDEGRFWLTCLQPGLVGGAEAFQYRIEEIMKMEQFTHGSSWKDYMHLE